MPYNKYHERSKEKITFLEESREHWSEARKSYHQHPVHLRKIQVEGANCNRVEEETPEVNKEKTVVIET